MDTIKHTRSKCGNAIFPGRKQVAVYCIKIIEIKSINSTCVTTNDLTVKSAYWSSVTQVTFNLPKCLFSPRSGQYWSHLCSYKYVRKYKNINFLYKGQDTVLWCRFYFAFGPLRSARVF